MKRSECIDLLTEKISRHYGKCTERDLANEVLDFLEELGMKPPGFIKQFGQVRGDSVAINEVFTEWEPE